MQNQVAECDKRTEAAESKANYLQDENAALKAQIALSLNAADDVEMASRRPYLVISNIPENTSKSDEDQFIELCNNKLHLDETITKEHIADVTRMKTNKRNETRQGKPESLIIKFKNEKTRNKVFAHKKNLKGSTNVISEFLTQRKTSLLKDVHEKIPGTFRERSIWTHHGKILVKMAGDNNKIHEIKSSMDIDNFRNKHQPASQPSATH